VIPAQLTARRGAAKIGITLDRPLPDGSWHALARNARRLRDGDTLAFDGSTALTATVRSRDPDGGVALDFNLTGADFAAALQEAGATGSAALYRPPAGPIEADRADYQTVFARHEAPSPPPPPAALHPRPPGRPRRSRIARETITLHVGAGTFLPLRHDDVARHTIHAERGEITAARRRPHQRRPRRRRPHRRRRHHHPAPAGNRCRRARPYPPLRRRDRAVSSCPAIVSAAPICC